MSAEHTENKSKSKFWIALCFVLALLCTLGGVNYFLVHAPLSSTIAKDPRNKGVVAFAHYQYFIQPNVLIFDLRSVSDTNAPMDVFRTLLQYAEAQKEHEFEFVYLQFRGNTKYVLKGEYFRKLGREFGTQNPIYTLRTFPENVFDPDGKQAFGSWTGGLLGVVGKQMEDFNAFHRGWYIADLTSAQSKK